MKPSLRHEFQMFPGGRFPSILPLETAFPSDTFRRDDILAWASPLLRRPPPGLDVGFWRRLLEQNCSRSPGLAFLYTVRIAVAFCEQTAIKGDPGKKELVTLDPRTLGHVRRLQERFSSLSEMLEDNAPVSLEFCELFQQMEMILRKIIFYQTKGPNDRPWFEIQDLYFDISVLSGRTHSNSVLNRGETPFYGAWYRELECLARKDAVWMP